MKAFAGLDRAKIIGEIDRRIYGSFIEHLGRAVYGGIYEPTHPTADDMGFRGDVMDMVKKLNVPIVRYPGGNFVSGYRWEDGVGNRADRPTRPELAWHVIETNEVGIDEFQEWARRAGTEVMEAVNLGTRGPQDAMNLLEYCNFPKGTFYSDMRRANGFEQPFNIKTWCLGNEMDGSWQIGSKTAEEYGRIACETAKLMKWLDPSIQLVVCGSSGFGMSTFGAWEKTVLEHTYEHVDFISLHSYYGNRSGNTLEFLASSEHLDRFIKAVKEICDNVKTTKKTDKTMYLSLDEWNVWFHSNDADSKLEPWQKAPHQLEDCYNFEDALVVGLLMMTILKNADRVKMACLAQLVNVIAPIMTENNGRAWAQTIYYPFMYTSKYATGTVLDINTECDCYSTGDIGAVPYINTVATYDGDGLTIIAVNRSLEQRAELEIALGEFAGMKLKHHFILECDDLLAVNTAENPDRVKVEDKGLSNVSDGILKASLAEHSWNLLRFERT